MREHRLHQSSANIEIATVVETSFIRAEIKTIQVKRVSGALSVSAEKISYYDPFPSELPM